MALLNHARKELSAKIVYYGPGLSGKTTNLEWIHRKLSPDKRGKLISLETKTDRTLFFDFLPVQIGEISGYKTRFNVYTVPGQVHYELTRRQVLAGADGVVMVVDSSPKVQQNNTWAMENLRFNLKQNGLDPDKIPTVIQWNKRDLPGARAVEEMNAELNPKGHTAFQAVATTGSGVVDTFAEIIKQSVVYTYAKTGRGNATSADSISQTVDQALSEAAKRQPEMPSASEGEGDARDPAPARARRGARRGRHGAGPRGGSALRPAERHHAVPADADRGPQAPDPPLARGARAPRGAAAAHPHGAAATGSAARGRGAAAAPGRAPRPAAAQGYSRAVSRRSFQ